MFIIAQGLAFYLLVCGISLFTGLGLLRLIRIQIEPRFILFLAPIITMIFWTMLLGVGVAFRFPVRQISIIAWSLTGLIAILGIWLTGYRVLKSEILLFLAGIFLPVALMVPFFGHGLFIYLGSLFPDGWSYIAYAQYLWEYPRGSEGGLSPLYQYAAHLSSTRFIASSFLGFFSPLIGKPGDTQMVSGLFLAWTLFIFSSACMLVSATRNWGRKSSFLYVTLCIFSGWILNLLWANNFDNALAIIFLPAFAGIIPLVNPKNRRWAMILGGLVSGTIYCYPEMALFILGGASLLFFDRFFSKGEKRGPWGILALITLGAGIIIVAPFGKEIISFFQNQLHSAIQNSMGRPGEGFFPELLNARDRLTAFWGMGGGDLSALFQSHTTAGTILGAIWKYGQNIIALVLSLLSLVGLIFLIKNREWGFFSLVSLLLLSSLVMIFYFSYSYGAYKFILLNWWGIILTVLIGTKSFLFRRSSRNRKVEFFFVLFFSSIAIIVSLRIFSFNTVFSQTVIPYKKLEEIKPIVHDAGVIVMIDDDLANQWAVYFLRNVAIYLSEYRSYMAQSHVIPYMERAKKIKLSEANYLLTDKVDTPFFSQGKYQWSGGPYKLWQVPKKDGVFITKVINKNGLETWDNELAFWIGEGDTEIHLLSLQAGQVTLQGWFIPGPSLPDKTRRRLLIQSDNGFQETMIVDKKGIQFISFPVSYGKNRLIIRPLDEPTLRLLPTGDRRPMLVGIKGLKSIALNGVPKI